MCSGRGGYVSVMGGGGDDHYVCRGQCRCLHRGWGGGYIITA